MNQNISEAVRCARHSEHYDIMYLAQAVGELLDELLVQRQAQALRRDTRHTFEQAVVRAVHKVAEELAQPEQEQNKNGSPCPEFWDWLPKAYNFEGNGNFTKYNMEVAFLAGKQASQPEQEPVAWSYWQSCLNDDGTQTAPWVHRLSKFKPSESVINKDIVPLYTTPPQRKPLTDEEIAEFAERMEASDPTDSFWREFARAIERAHNIQEQA